MQIPFQMGPSLKGDEKFALNEAEIDVASSVLTTFEHVFDAANPKAEPVLTIELEAELKTQKVVSAEEGEEPLIAGEDGEDWSLIGEAPVDTEIPMAAARSADVTAELSPSATTYTETAHTEPQGEVQTIGLVDGSGQSAKSHAVESQASAPDGHNRVAAVESINRPDAARHYVVEDKTATPRVNDGTATIKETLVEKAYVAPPPSRFETIATAKMLDLSMLRHAMAGQQLPEQQVGVSALPPSQLAQVPSAVPIAPAVQLGQMAVAANAPAPQADEVNKKTDDIRSPGRITRDIASLHATPILRNSETAFVHTPPTQNQIQVMQSAANLLQTIEISERGNSTRFDAMETLSWDVRSSVTTSHAPTVLPTRVEMPPHIAQAIAQSLHVSPDKSVEIALNPAELGRVRIVMTPSETGMTVNILADRPETLDLMRRNIDDLGRSISDLGYEDINFSFGQDDTSADTSERHEGSADTLALNVELVDHTTTSNSQLSALAIAPDGIDMRL